MTLPDTKIAFLDRDGVVNIDHGYVFRADDFEFTQDFFPACTLLAAAGYRLVIVTNQSGIARGYYTQNDFASLTEWLTQQFSSHGLILEAVYHCPHGVDSHCECRKPKPGMVNAHLALTGLAATDCVMFGDKPSDMHCAQAAGLGRFFMIDVGRNPRHFYDTVANLVSTQTIELPKTT